MAGISPSVELIDDAACELIGIGPQRAGEYALVLAADGLELPEGWSASDPYRGLVGWDVIVVAPRSLSILRGDLVAYYFSRREYRLSVELADPDAAHPPCAWRARLERLPAGGGADGGGGPVGDRRLLPAPA